MKILWFLLFINAAAIVFPDDITGQWWRYNEDSKDHDELIINENLGFTLRATIAGKLESYEGQIQVIGGQNYYAQVNYNGAIKNGHLYGKNISVAIYLVIYEDETEEIYRGRFEREKEFPPDEDTGEEKERVFVFWPMFGMFGGGINISNNYQLEYSLSLEIPSLNFIYLPAGLGLEIIPFNYSYNFLAKSHKMSFIDIGLSWNILDFPLKIGNDSVQYLFFGPVFSVNWLNLYDLKYLNINKVIFNSGLKFSLGERACRWLILETGYRNNGGAHEYYFSIHVDLMIPLVFSAIPIVWPVFFWDID